jgi:hypothetical protein
VLVVQDHACVFLRSQGGSSLWIHCTRTNGEWTVLFGSAEKVTGICLEEDPNFGLTSGFSIITMTLRLMH